MRPHPSVPDWNQLVAEWQVLGRQWADWWMHGDGVGAPALDTGNAALAVLAPAEAWIDPAAATELTERYNLRFNALWEHAVARAAGAPEAAGAAPTEVHDRRFGARAWREQPYFAWLRDAYLLYAEYVRELAELAQCDPATKRRIRFLARQYVDAIAPSNFLATNPEAISLAMQSAGASVARGLSNLLADTQRGRITMTDESAFEVGRNLAVTPGSVIFRNELIELIQYAPATAKVYKRPLVIVPPCINKYYILDLKPENSFIRYAVGEGHTVFIISWRNVPRELGHLGWDDYLEDGVLTAIEAARSISGSATVNGLGFCVGGTLLACALAVLAARREAAVASASFLTTMLDFSDPGDIGVYVSPEYLASRQPMLQNGRVHGSELTGAFASLRPNELVWNYVVGNYLKGATPPPFDLLYWNSDSANLPGPMYSYYLRNCYIDNRLREPRALTMCGEAIDLASIALPTYVYASREDHIVPWRTAYRTVSLLGGGDISFILGASGHIAGVVNPPTSKRRQYWTSALLTDDPDEWLARAQPNPGSWWPHWAKWLEAYAGAHRDAPKAPGNARYRPLAAAPGSYVRETT